MISLLHTRRLLCAAALTMLAASALAIPIPIHAAAGDVPLAPSEKGIEIDAGPLGKLMLLVPELATRSDGQQNQKPLGVTLEGASGYKASYPGGVELTVNVEGSKITCTYAGPTENAHGFRFRLHLPINLKQGGEYAFGDRNGAVTYTPFPLEYKEKQLHGARGKEFRFKNALGKGLAIHTPVAHQELQDNRGYNWQIYAYILNFAFRDNAGKDSFEIECRLFANDNAMLSAPAPRKFIADSFGQSVLKDFPDKVTSENQLKADIPRQKAYFESLSSPTLDSYGGLPDSGKQYGLKQTGFFHIQKLKDRLVMVNPEGNLFYSLGVCSLAVYQTDTLVKGRENVYEWLPPSAPGGEFSEAWSANGTVFSFYVANWMRKNGVPFDMEVWMKEQIFRLRKWGFNTGGIGTAVTETGKSAHFPVTLGLPLAKWNAPGITMMQGIDRTYDPFADSTEEAMDKAFAQKIAPEAGNPNIIGYFIENEVLHENIGRIVPAQKGNSPSKRRLVQMLEEKYKEIAAFNAAWKPKAPFTSFQDLNDAGLLPVTPEAAADLRVFQELFLETHFSRVHRLFRKYDTNHLLLGSRWQPGTANHQEIVRIASKYTDVVSFNYYTYAIEPAFLKRVHEWSGNKAMLMSEWNYTTSDQGLSGGKEVATQGERGRAYRNYVENTAALPFIVGSQWFTYPDQPLTGRSFEGYNGEGGNTGLINVSDRFYTDFVAETKKTNDEIYQVVLGQRPPFRFQDPRFAARGGTASKTLAIPRALPAMKLDGTSQNWPGRPPERISPTNLTQGTPDPDFSASFRLCWDDANLYVLAEVRDKTPMINPLSGSAMWRGDCLELFIGGEKLGESGPLLPSDRQILLSAAEQPQAFATNQPIQPQGIRIVTTKNLSGDGYAIQAALPWTDLGIKPEPGKELLFNLGIDNSDDGSLRTRQWMWDGTERTSKDRGGWGRAKLQMN